MTLPRFLLRRRSVARADDVLGRSGREALHFPVQLPSRIAVVDADFRAAPHLRHFTSANRDALIEYAPEAIALPIGTALALTDLNLPTLTSLVVFSSLHDGPLTNCDRDLLWKSFRVPVFEQLRAPDGRILARECEVHDGLHLDSATTFPPEETTAEITHEQCNCGSESPRLLRLARTKPRTAAAAA